MKINFFTLAPIVMKCHVVSKYFKYRRERTANWIGIYSIGLKAKTAMKKNTSNCTVAAIL